MVETPLFTIITLAYCRLDFTRQSLQAIMGQTYKNLEIIVVNNGATDEITDYLINAKVSDNRIKIIHFTENQFSYDDPALTFRVCFSAALKAVTGEYIFYQSDDDLMANDYVEKMVALFQDNPNCTSAMGLIKSIDEAGRLNDQGARVSNYRSRYMPGHLLALNVLCKNKYGAGIMYSAPGTIFTFKRDEFVKAGGFHSAIELSHLYGIVPFGVTGFDETAVFYWRHHADQTNKHFVAVGHIGLKEILLLIQDWQIEKRWQVFGKDVAQYVVRRILEDVYRTASDWFVINLYHFRFKACWRMLKDAGNNLYFWSQLPAMFWIERREFWYYLKPKLRRIFEAHPWLTQKVPFLMIIKVRVFK